MTITQAEEVKTIGVTFDSEHTFENNIGKGFCACYYNLMVFATYP